MNANTDASPQGPGADEGRPRCAECVFSAPSSELNRRVCNRNPPTPMLVNTASGPAFIPARPLVSVDDWCGEFAVPEEQLH